MGKEKEFDPLSRPVNIRPPHFHLSHPVFLMKTFHSPLSPLLGCASEPDSQDLDDFCPSSFQSVRLDGKREKRGEDWRGGADINYSSVVQRGKYRLDAWASAAEALTFNEVASSRYIGKERGREEDGVN